MERKTVLITGCAPGGIGHALAISFLNHNFHVIATARSLSQLTTLSSLGATTLALDVTSTSSITSVKSQIITLTNNKLDILINNAGRNYTVPATDIDISEVRLTMETNFIAVVAMCQAFIPLLINTKGIIVQIGSVAGVMPYVFGSVYNASKAALHQYSETLRLELAPFDVDVITIVTGGVKSCIARTDRTLPEGSFYARITEEYERRVKHSQENAMPAEVYAEEVVQKVLSKGKGKGSSKFWVGHRVWAIWLLMCVFPRQFIEWYFTKTFGLWKLKEKKKDV